MNLQNEFNSFFTPDVIDRLGGLIGLDRSQTEMGLRQVLPHQLDGLADAASNPQTAGSLDRALGRQDLPTDPMAALSDPAAAARTEEMGTGLMSELLGGQGFMNRLGGLSGNLTRLPAMSLPLLLGFLKRSGVHSAADLTDLKGSLSSMLPAGAAGLAGAAAVSHMSDRAEVVDSVAATPEVEVREGTPVTPAPQPTPTPPPPPAKEKSGCNPLWLLPLLLLLGLGWWIYTMYQPEEIETVVPPVVTETVVEEEQPTEVVETTEGAEGNVEEGIVVENPQDGSTVPLEPFEMGGYGPPEEVITITNQNGEILATETIDDGRNWVTELPAPLEGENIYTLTSEPSGAVSEVRIIGEAGAVTPDLIESDAPVVAPVEILEPVVGAEVPAETFIISGTGQPNASYTVFEDGVSLGTVFADETGAWNIDVTAAEPGDRTYIVVDERGNQVAELPLVIAQPVAVDDCDINEVLSLSLEDGDTVSAPFRFGGIGSADSYLVKVFRGEDQIGETVVENGPNCTWSYLSQPGGEADEIGEITYAVYPEGSDTVDTRITLNVIQSGVNFVNGEYVGPVTEPATVE